MVRRITLLFGAGLVAVGMVTSVPASASSTVSTRVPPAQVLGHLALSRQASPANPTAGFAEGTTSSGTAAAFTDDGAKQFGEGGAGTRPSASLAPFVTSQNQSEGGVQSVKGLNAFNMANTHGFVVEPPDQGLCANGSNVIEMVNMDFQVFDSHLNALSGPIVLETFFGEPLAFGFVPGTDVTVQGDPRCLWDQGTQRWYLSQLVVDFTENTSVFQVAVSTSSNPLGSYNIYTFDNTDKHNPGCPCLGDQPTLGVNQDALFVSTNEFGLNTNEFNGTVVYTIDKQGLAAGNAKVNIVTDFVGLTFPTPEWNSTTNCLAPNEGLFCWATLRPAYGPADSLNGGGTSANGGTEYLLSALDFANVKDNRIAAWAMTNTSSIRDKDPNLHLANNVMNSEAYTFPTGFASQKAGPIPLGDSGLQSCIGQPTPCTQHPQPEGGLQTNDDQFGSAFFADGRLWGGLNTQMAGNSHQLAWFVVDVGAGISAAAIHNQGYLAAPGENIEFGSIAVTSAGQGLISFTLSGPDFFPTSAFALIDAGGVGPVQVAALGQSPQDGFSEYRRLGLPTYRPRWGDYSMAVAVGDRFVFASEYIEFANCSDAVFATDRTCGGTRSRSANWGTSVNVLAAGD